MLSVEIGPQSPARSDPLGNIYMKLRFSRLDVPFLIRGVVFSSICSFVAGCDDEANSPPPIHAGETQAWYGRANAWASAGLDALRTDVDACADAGVTGYMIELGGWGASTVFENDAAKAATEEAYGKLVGWCRSRGLWLFVTVGNDNAGFGGYGDRGIPLSKQTDTLEWAIDLVRSNGAQNVIVQPCAETKTATGFWLEERCAEQLDSFTLVCNGTGGRPAQTTPWASFRAWHPLLGEDSPPDALIISDSGDLIRLLSRDGSLDGPGDPDKLRAWVRRVKAKGSPVAGYYAFRNAQHDAPAIQALGEGLQP